MKGLEDRMRWNLSEQRAKIQRGRKYKRKDETQNNLIEYQTNRRSKSKL